MAQVTEERLREIYEQTKLLVPVVLTIPACRCLPCMVHAALQMGWQLGELHREASEAALSDLERMGALTDLRPCEHSTAADAPASAPKADSHE